MWKEWYRFMKTAIYPGSFDPITLGHLNIIKRAANCFDRLIVCVMVNLDKQGMFPPQKRAEMIRRVTMGVPNVEVDTSSALLTDYAREKGATVVIKGLRAVSDFDKEFQMALINRRLNPQLDTMFLTASEKYMYLSSSAIKELAHYGVDLSGWVPWEIIDDVEQKIQELRSEIPLF